VWVSSPDAVRTRRTVQRGADDRWAEQCSHSRPIRAPSPQRDSLFRVRVRRRRLPSVALFEPADEYTKDGSPLAWTAIFVAGQRRPQRDSLLCVRVRRRRVASVARFEPADEYTKDRSPLAWTATFVAGQRRPQGEPCVADSFDLRRLLRSDMLPVLEMSYVA